jgi:transposase, IS5 family
LRDRSRGVKHRLIEIGRAARGKTEPCRDKMKRAYSKLVEATGRVVGQAKRFSKEIGTGVKRCTDAAEQLALEGQRQLLDQMVPRVQQVLRQTKARIFAGDTHSEGKIVSVFEPSTEVIRKGKSGKLTEFGKLIKLQEAENQIVIDYVVYDQRPSLSELLIPALEVHEAKLGCIPRLIAADAGFSSAKNDAAAKAKGVKRVCIPNYNSKNPTRKREQKKRWFRNGQRWCAGCEGRISVSKRRHGLNRCRYRGDNGMKRWVGLEAISDNLINIGHAIENQSAK